MSVLYLRLTVAIISFVDECAALIRYGVAHRQTSRSEQGHEGLIRARRRPHSTFAKESC